MINEWIDVSNRRKHKHLGDTFIIFIFFFTHWYMNYLHVCWLCSSEFHFALAFDVVVAASCFLLRIQKHLSREILPHTLEVKRSSRSQPDLIFCSNILSSGHHSSQLAISYKIQYHIQQQQHSQNHQVINHKRIFALFPLYSPNIQDTSESQYSFKAKVHSMTKSSIFFQ